LSRRKPSATMNPEPIFPPLFTLTFSTEESPGHVNSWLTLASCATEVPGSGTSQNGHPVFYNNEVSDKVTWTRHCCGLLLWLFTRVKPKHFFAWILSLVCCVLRRNCAMTLHIEQVPFAQKINWIPAAVFLSVRLRQNSFYAQFKFTLYSTVWHDHRVSSPSHTVTCFFYRAFVRFIYSCVTKLFKLEEFLRF
jgi:hypothetical protein